MPIRVLIVDDEPLARERIRDLLAKEPAFTVVGEAIDGPSAIAAVDQHKPELIFLDVQMPGMNGFEVLENLKTLGLPSLPSIVFVTAHDRFALKAFDVHAIDYLLKPFDRERFKVTLDRVQKTIEQRTDGSSDTKLDAMIQNLQQQGHSSNRIAIKDGEKIVMVPVAEIDWIEAADNYVVIHHHARSLIVRDTLSAFERKLGSRGFLRISRSTIVNTERIAEIHPVTNGEYTIVLKGNVRLNSGRTYKESVRAILSV